MEAEMSFNNIENFPMPWSNDKRIQDPARVGLVSNLEI